MLRCRIESLGSSWPKRTILPHGSIAHALNAARSCLKSSRYRPNDVDVLINCGIHRDRHICEPAMAVYIQHRLGINIEFGQRPTLSFDLQNGACGMLNAAQALSGLLLDGAVSTGLIVSSEVNPDPKPDPDWPYPASGAALMLDMSPLSETGFSGFSFQTRAEHADLFTSYVDLGVKRGRLVMNRAHELESVYLSMADDVIDTVLKADGVQRSEIDRVISAQISPPFIKKLAADFGFPRDKVMDFTHFLPDTHSTSLVLTLNHSCSVRPLQRGETVLLLAFGSGVTAGAAIYRG